MLFTEHLQATAPRSRIRVNDSGDLNSNSQFPLPAESYIPEQVPIRPRACSFIKKETMEHVFSCEFYKIFKNPFFTEHLWWLLL